MSNIASKILMFAAGATIGSLVTWQITKKKYEQLALDEINSWKEYYRRKAEEVEEKQEEEEEHPVYTNSKPDILEYAKRISELGYDSGLPVENERRGDPLTMDRPHVIPPETYDTVGYETVTLTYYADGVLAEDGEDIIVSNAAELVGEDFADHFGEYEEDSVFIRNDDLRVDYEICRDYRNYSDVVGPGE